MQENNQNQNGANALANGIGAIFDGIGKIIVGTIEIVCNVVDAVFEVVACALNAALWIVSGVLTVAGDLLKYVGESISKAFTPNAVVVVPPKKMPSLVNFLNAEAEKNGIAEDPEVMEINRKMDEAVKNGEAMVYTVGKDNEGQVAVGNPTMVKAEAYDGPISKAEEEGKIYVKPVRVAS